mgnify:CR=1 FL=1
MAPAQDLGDPGCQQAPDHVGPVAGLSYNGAKRWQSPIEGERPSASDLAQDLDLAKLDSLVHEIPLDGALAAGADILAGQVRGRLVVNVNA